MNSRWILLSATILAILLTFANPNSDSPKLFLSLSSSIDDGEFDAIPSVILASDGDRSSEGALTTGLEYDFYRKSCPDAERIVMSAMAEIYSRHRDVSPALLRLFFHDCFVHGCDASILLDDSDATRSHSSEKQAVPNRTLKGFDKIDIVKAELERVCPGVVSCADVVSLATRDGVVLAGGPYYPVFTGRRDSVRSYHDEALAHIPTPDDHLPRILNLFTQKGFNERETVSLLGAHNIGQMGCEFIRNRLYNFNRTGRPDPSLAPDFLDEMRQKCENNNSVSARTGLSEELLSGVDFDTHYYQSLLSGRGLLFADQQLMAGERTERLVKAYASDDGSTFRVDFARVMMKLSSLDVITGTEGQVRLNCSLPLFSSR